MYRADHVGSLLRPAELLEARTTTLEDQSILHALERQKELGFRIFTDGEFRRGGFMSDFYDSVEGLNPADDIKRTWQGAKTRTGIGLAGVVSAKLKQHQTPDQPRDRVPKPARPRRHQDDSADRQSVPGHRYSVRKTGVSEQAYPTRSDFLWDIVPIIKSEIQALIAEGVKYIQIDAPRYSYYIDPKWRGYIKDEMGMDPDEALDEAIRADNACLAGLNRDGVTIAFHLCRGNNRSRWYAEGGYDPIAEKLFNQLNVDQFLLEYESGRRALGSFEPLRFMPWRARKQSASL